MQPPEDPALKLLEQQTQNQNIQAMQNQSAQDTAHLAQQYGIRAIFGGAGVVPSLSAPAGASLNPMSMRGDR